MTPFGTLLLMVYQLFYFGGGYGFIRPRADMVLSAPKFWDMEIPALLLCSSISALVAGMKIHMYSTLAYHEF